MRLGIGLKIVLVIESVILGASLVAGLILYSVSREVFQDRIFSQLESVAVVKEETIVRFLDEIKTELEHLTKYPVTNELMQKYFKADKKADRGEAERVLGEVLKHKDIFSEVYLFDKDGVIIFATNVADEGKLVKDEPYFTKAKEHTYLQDFYFDPAVGQPVMMMTTPVKDNDGNLLGIIGGRINIQQISDLMKIKSGMGETGETFLVNSFNVAVTELVKEPGVIMKKTIFNPQVSACLEGNSTKKLATDYHGDKVIGYWKWIPSIRSCMVTKMNQEEAFLPIENTYRTLMGVFGVAFALAIVFGLLLGRGIVNPIRKLRDEALKVKQGNYDVDIKINSRDEIQEVAETFNEMAREIKTSHQYLENRIREKTEDLENKVLELEKTNELMVGRELKMIEMKKALAGLKGGSEI